MVVFIHILFYGKFGIMVDALARFAVPFFFLVSGYFSYQINCEKIIKRIKHIFSLFVFSAVCCTVFEIIRLLKYDMDSLTALLNKCTDLSTYVKLLVFNLPISSGHLWYLLAVFYVYIIFYFITKFHLNEKLIFGVAFILLFLHMVLGELFSIQGTALPIRYLRNFALMGFPFFAFGLLARKHENKLQNISNPILIIAIIIGCIESAFSRLFYWEKELYIGSLLILFALVVFFIKYSDVKYPKSFSVLTGCSTYIYIFHILVSDVIYTVYAMCNIDINSVALLKYMHPIVVCIASTVLAIFITQANVLVKKLIRSK
jgi:surface polysaccharide O-acyltransferase-like enzyme